MDKSKTDLEKRIEWLEEIIQQDLQVICELRRFFNEMAPIYDQVNGDDKIIDMIVTGKASLVSEAIKEGVLYIKKGDIFEKVEYPENVDDEEIDEEYECQCGDHEEHKRRLNPENYDEDGNELEKTPEWFDGDRKEYSDYKEGSD